MLAVEIFMSILFAVLVAVVVLNWTGWLTTKELGGYYVFHFGIEFVYGSVTGEGPVWLFFDLLLVAVGYFLWKKGSDSDDTKRRRKKLLEKVGKKLPKPTLVNIRPIGVPT